MALTTDDLKKIKNIHLSNEGQLLKKIKVMFDESLEIKLEEKLEEKFKDKLGGLPSKEEFYEQTDKLMKELKDSREEHTMLRGRIYDNTDRLDHLEKIHPEYTHVALA
jgi:hypothetical protein